MDSGVGDEVGLELGNIDVQGTIESEGGSETAEGEGEEEGME